MGHGRAGTGRGGRPRGNAPGLRAFVELVARHPGLPRAAYVKMMGGAKHGYTYARRAEAEGMIEIRQPSAKAEALYPSMEFERIRPNPPAGRWASRLLGVVESLPGLTVTQLGSDHGLNADAVRTLVAQFEAAGVFYTVGKTSFATKQVFPVPRDWPSRIRIAPASSEREKVLHVGQGARDGRLTVPSVSAEPAAQASQSESEHKELLSDDRQSWAAGQGARPTPAGICRR